MVIGRPGYDNYLVAHAVAERGRVSSVDVTNALVALHQTDDDGVKAGHRARLDRVYNLKLIGQQWRDGRTTDCPWRVEQFPRGWFALLRRGTRAGTAFDDDLLRAERAWLQQWIRPEDVCVEVEERVVSGVLGELCRRMVVMVRQGDYVEQASERRVKRSEMKEVLPWNVEVVSQQRKREERRECAWDEGVEALPEGVDVVVLNGRCAVHMAMDVGGKLKEGGVLIVRGTKLREEARLPYKVIGE